MKRFKSNNKIATEKATQLKKQASQSKMKKNDTKKQKKESGKRDGNISALIKENPEEHKGKQTGTSHSQLVDEVDKDAK